MRNRPASLLLVEDSLADQKLIQLWLQPSTIVEITQIVSDGGEVLHALRDGVPRPQIVLLDVHLPRVDGFEVLATIRGSDDLADLPIIMMAAAVDRQRAEKLGADLVIEKPADADEFSQMVETVERFVTDQGL